MRESEARLIVTAVTRQTDLPSPTDGHVESAVLAAAQTVGLCLADIHVVFCDDAEISDVHGEFFDDPTPTDVITFPIEGDGRSTRLFGELLVSVETACRVADEQAHDAVTEALLYVIHGVLHLGGSDDQDDAARAEMRQFEQIALQKLGRTVHYFT